MIFYFAKRSVRRPRCLALSVVLLAFGGCTSTGVGNPAPALTLSLSIVNDDSPEAIDLGAAGAGGATEDVGSAGAEEDVAGAAPDAAGATGTPLGEAGIANETPPTAQPLPLGWIQDAVIVLGRLHFMPCDKTQGRVFTAPGPFVVDLKHRTTTPEIPDIQGTPGGYCGIDAPLAPATAPAALSGRSVFFDGHRADGTFFIVYANMTGTLRLRAKAGATWQAMAEPPRFFWALHPRRWLLTAELSAAEPTPYDNHLRAVVIDQDQHAALFFALRARIAGVSKLYADADGDGVFDDADREAEVGEGLDNAD
ncbi:MAG: hypothetical protein ABI548_22725 [Polyangiaceae bacterium]